MNSFDHLRQAVTFVMPPKKSSRLGAALQPLDVNQDTVREARNQKRKATSPTPQKEELYQEIRDLKAIHQQVQRKKEKTAQSSTITFWLIVNVRDMNVILPMLRLVPINR